MQVIAQRKIEQLLKKRGILDDDFLQLHLPRQRCYPTRCNQHTQASKARRVDPNAAEADAASQQQALQQRAAGDHGVQRGLRDGDILESEMLEPREAKVMDGGVLELAPADGGDVEGIRESEEGYRWRRGRRRRRAAAVAEELELLKVVDGGGSEPGIHGVAAAVGGDAEAAAWARVGGEDGGDDAGDGYGEGVPLVVAAEGEEATVVEAERRGAPEMAPPLGEDLRAAGFPGGEASDDVAEDVVREVPDEVAGAGLLITIIFFLLRPPPLRAASSFLFWRVNFSMALVRDQYGFLDMAHGRRVAWRQLAAWDAAARTEGRRRGGKTGRSVRPKKTASSCSLFHVRMGQAPLNGPVLETLLTQFSFGFFFIY